MKTYTQMKSIQNFNKKALLGALVAAGMTMASTGVYAATSTGTLNTTASVTASCTISSPTLALGAYVPGATTAVLGQTNIAVNCTNGSAFDIFSTTAILSRTMTTGDGLANKVLTYKLHAAAPAATADLPIAIGAGDISGTGGGVAADVPIYASIAAGQNVFAGSYAGSANLTISF